MPARATDSDRLISVVCGQVADNAPLSGIDVVLTAQHHGFTDVWIGEAATYDVFALATAIGTRTEGLRFTLGPLPVGVRDPVTIARGVASVAILTGQQVDIALGTSSDLVVEGWHGRTRTRAVRSLSETAAAVRPLLHGAKSAFAGELVRTSGYQLKLPAPASTVTIAGFGELAIDAAVRHADRLVINLVTPALAAAIARWLATAADRAGVVRPRLAAWIPTAVDPSDEALELLRRALVGYVGAPGYCDMLTAAGFGELVELAQAGGGPKAVLAAMPVDLPRALGAVGSGDEVTDAIQRYFDAGVDEVCVLPAVAGDPAGERTLGFVSTLKAMEATP